MHVHRVDMDVTSTRQSVVGRMGGYARAKDSRPRMKARNNEPGLEALVREGDKGT